MSLQKGEKAPDFSLPSSEGGEVRLKDFQGEKSVLLFFYPKDSTPGCTKEACGFRDLYQKFQKLKTVVFGISLDPLESHEKFINKYELPFPLLSDKEIKVSKAYGVYSQKNMYGKRYWGINRTTFLINQDGIIEEIFHKVKVETHPQEVLDKIKERS